MAHEPVTSSVDKDMFLSPAEPSSVKIINSLAIAYKLTLLVAILAWIGYGFWKASQRPLDSPFPQLVYAAPTIFLMTFPVIGSLAAILYHCLSKPAAFDLTKPRYRQLYLPIGVEGIIMIGGAFVYYPWQSEWILLVWMQALGLGLTVLYCGAMFVSVDEESIASALNNRVVILFKKCMSALTHPVR